MLAGRDIKLPAAASSENGGVGEDGLLSGGSSLSGINTSSSHLTVVPPTPGQGPLMSALSTQGVQVVDPASQIS